MDEQEEINQEVAKVEIDPSVAQGGDGDQKLLPDDDGILERTLAIIKPDAMKHSEEIINIIKREGFSIIDRRLVQLSAEQAAAFYKDDYQSESFAGNVTNLCSGPALAMVLCGPRAIEHWIELLGSESFPERSQDETCLRSMFGTPGDDAKNGLHGSENEMEALRELHFFFPDLIIEPIMSDNLASHYLNQNVHPVLTVALSRLVREKPQDPVVWLADWLLANNPNKPKEVALGATCT